jgi:hypothetical protein
MSQGQTMRISHRGRAASIAAAAILGVASILVPNGPAFANDGDCGPGDLCLWEHSDMSGGRWDDSGYVANYASGHRWWGTDRTVNDSASSLRSRYSFWVVKIYEHSWYRGKNLLIYPDGEIYNLTDYDFNDVASSNYY